MSRRANTISKIQELLQAHPKGLTINDISKALSLNRISTARYLESLLFSGKAEMRRFGCAKVYSLASRLPVSSILDICPSPVMILDDELFIRFVNSCFIALSERENQALVGHNLRFAGLSELVPETLVNLAKKAIDGQAGSMEKSIEHKGMKCFFRIHIVPVILETGQNGCAFVLEDRTEIRQYQYHLETMIGERTAKLQEANERLRMENEGHKRAKEDIRASQQKYRALVEDMPAYICTFEPDGTLTFVNDNFCRFTMKAFEDLIGSSLYAMIPQSDLASLARSLETITPTGQSVTNIKSVPDCNNHQTWQQWTTRAFFDKHGKAIEYQSIGIDITDQVKAERDLADQWAKLDAIIRGSPHPQMVIDTSHRIVSWNRAMVRFTGIPADAMIGIVSPGKTLSEKNLPCIADLIIDGRYEDIFRLYPLISRKSQYLDDAWEGITFSTAHSEKGNWVHFTAAAIRDQSGKITHVVETMEDLVEYPVKKGSVFLSYPFDLGSEAQKL
ncbi:MAG: PAS domain-containing protein [Methanoregula sp.]|jgi:PAS domain S-box-containing protein